MSSEEGAKGLGHFAWFFHLQEMMRARKDECFPVRQPRAQGSMRLTEARPQRFTLATKHRQHWLRHELRLFLVEVPGEQAG
jgi:hypothetical protein